MDAPVSLPKVFANRLIRQIVDHSFGADLVIEPKDYLTMRTAFRSLKGSWDRVSLGDPAQLDLLKQVVTQWGQMPNHKKKSEDFV